VSAKALVPPTDPYGYPIARVPHAQIRRLLIQRNYHRLETVLNEFQKNFNQDCRYEKQLNGAFESFQINDPQLLHFLDAWIKADPQSINAHLSRAYYYTGVGWKIYNDKGNDDYVNAKQFPLIKPYVALVEKDVDFVIKKQNDSLPAYLTLASINWAVGKVPTARRLIKRALTRHPYSLLLRINYISLMKPMFGGSYENMYRFAAESERYSPYNPALNLLFGFSWSERARREINGHFYQAALLDCNKALTYGEYYLFYHRRACCYQELGEYELALKDVNRAIGLNPGYYSSYLLCAYLHAKLQVMESCRKDLQTAEELSPRDPRTLSTKKMIDENK
jgi:Tfp pilus assembly protein PilF